MARARWFVSGPLMIVGRGWLLLLLLLASVVLAVAPELGPASVERQAAGGWRPIV